MALTKQGAFSKEPNDLPDTPSSYYSPEEIKSFWQTPNNELKTTLNKLIDDLESVTSGNSGADQIKSSGVPGVEGDNVQKLLENLKIAVDNAIVGQIPQGTYVNVARGGTATIAGNTDSKITFQSEYDDALNEMSADTFIPKVTGIYTVSASIIWGAAPSGGRTTLRLYEDGVVNASLVLGGNGLEVVSSSRTMKLTAGKSYTFYVNQNTSSSTELISATVQIARL